MKKYRKILSVLLTAVMITMTIVPAYATTAEEPQLAQEENAEPEQSIIDEKQNLSEEQLPEEENVAAPGSIQEVIGDYQLDAHDHNIMLETKLASPNTVDMHVRFNHIDLTNWMNRYHKDEESWTLNLSTIIGALAGVSGKIELIRNAETGLIDTVNFYDVKLNYYKKFDGEQDPGALFVNATEPGTYNVNFYGDNELLYKENPAARDANDSFGFLAVFAPGSDVTFAGIDAETGTDTAADSSKASLKAQGINVQEYSSAKALTDPTQFAFENLAISSRVPDDLAIMTYGTQLSYTDCDIEAVSGTDKPHCMILGIGNTQYDDDMFTVDFTGCNINLTNGYTDTTHTDLGYPAPSAFNSSHTYVTFTDCDTKLNVPHIAQGECRGIYMLHGGVTIDGGTMDITVGDDPLDDISNLEYACGIQAVNVTVVDAILDIDVTIDLERYKDPGHYCSTWGIIYAQNVIIENADVDIDLDGSNCQGIYYYGRSTSVQADDITSLVQRRTALVTAAMGYQYVIALEEYYPSIQQAKIALLADEIELLRGMCVNSFTPTDQLQIANADYPYGCVEITDSDVDIKATGESKSYVNNGISARHIYFDLPYGSDKKITITTESTDCDHALAVAAYNFRGSDGQPNGNLTLQNAAQVEAPAPYSIKENAAEYYEGTKFYSIDTADGIPAKTVVIGAKDYHHGSSGGSGTSKPAGAITGNWTYMANVDKWTFTSSEGKVYRNEWAYIYNPYATGAKYAASWFFFDANSIMLTGYQWIPSLAGGMRLFYFHEAPDGLRGRMYASEATPYGGFADGNGWVSINGVLQVK